MSLGAARQVCTHTSGYVLTFPIATAYGCMVQTTYANRLGTHVICCPNSVVPVWVNELSKMYPNQKNIVKFQGLEAERNRALKRIIELYGNIIIILPYSQAQNFTKLIGLLSAVFDSFTLDESHFIKNPKTIRHQECLKIAQAAASITGLTGIVFPPPFFCKDSFQ